MSNDANKVTNVNPIPIDPVYASSVALQGTNEEFLLIFSRNRPAFASACSRWRTCLHYHVERAYTERFKRNS